MSYVSTESKSRHLTAFDECRQATVSGARQRHSVRFCLGVDLSSLCLGGHEKFYANCYYVRFLLRKHHLSQALLCL